MQKTDSRKSSPELRVSALIEKRSDRSDQGVTRPTQTRNARRIPTTGAPHGDGDGAEPDAAIMLRDDGYRFVKLWPMRNASPMPQAGVPGCPTTGLSKDRRYDGVMALPRQDHRGPRPARPRLRLVHRGVRYRRSERGEGSPSGLPNIAAAIESPNRPRRSVSRKGCRCRPAIGHFLPIAGH